MISRSPLKSWRFWLAISIAIGLSQVAGALYGFVASLIVGVAAGYAAGTLSSKLDINAARKR